MTKAKHEYVQLYRVGWLVLQLRERGYTTTAVAAMTGVPKHRLYAAVRAYRADDVTTRVHKDSVIGLNILLAKKKIRLASMPVTENERRQITELMHALLDGDMTMAHIRRVTGLSNEIYGNLRDAQKTLTYGTYQKLMSHRSKLLSDLEIGAGTRDQTTLVRARKAAITKKSRHYVALAEQIAATLEHNPEATPSDLARELHVQTTTIDAVDRIYHVIPEENRPRRKSYLAAKRYLKLLKNDPQITNDEAMAQLGVTRSTFYAMRRDLKAQGRI